MSVLTRSPIILNGLVLHLDAANRKSYPGSGTTWFDMSGNANNGTLTNGPVYTNANGGAIVFDGVDDHIYTAGISNTLTQFTIETWIYITQAQPNDFASIVFSRGGSGIVTGLHFLGSAYGGDGYKLSYTYNGSGYTWAGAPSINQIGWTHITLVFVNNKAIFYINGLFRAENAQSLSTTNLSSLNIGRDSSTFSRYFKGNIASVKIYTNPLSAQEILQNYNAQKARFGL